MIRIIVDSSSDYTMEEIKEKDLTLVSLTVNIDGTSYIEGENLGRTEFYERLKTCQEFPKTSQPSPESFLNIFNEAKEAGDDVICILLSSALSGTCQCAHLAKSMAEYDNIHIIDSLTATAGIRVIAEYALKLVAEGLSAEAIVEKVEAMKSRVRIFAALDTLEFLYKGGRLSKASATIGTLARLKPIISVNEEGKIDVVGKAIGRQKAVSGILSNLEKYEPDTDFSLVTIYTYDADNCEKLEDKLTKMNITNDVRADIGAIIGAHVGPGAYGVAYVSKN
jgi:DegV family protein with EDD domain